MSEEATIDGCRDGERQVAIEEIYEFLHESMRVKKEYLRPDSDLCFDLGIDGDDWGYELLPDYQKRFGVNLDGYLWYFHHGEEGCNFPGGLFFPPPNKRVQHIPVTPQLLLDCARSGRWNVDYPPHEPPKRRADIMINLGCGIAGLIVGGIMLGICLVGKISSRCC